jgi:SAM-dependent methyltransferase
MNHRDHVNLLRPANLAPGGTWADLGAGSGAFTLALHELFGMETVIYAVDRDRLRLGELERAWSSRFGESASLHLLSADFTRRLNIPLLDGVLMANSLHFFPDADKRGRTRSLTSVSPRSPRSSASHSQGKLSILQHIGAFLKPGGTLLLVEYNVDSGNLWVPYPLSFETYRRLAPRAGFSEPRLLATHPSSFLRGFYSALAYKNEQGRP